METSLRKLITFSVMSLLLSQPVFAADQEIALFIHAHQFQPSELKVPAHQRIRLAVKNLDDTPEEFESHALNREKLIPAGGSAVIYIGPLKPGRYDFFGEFNPSSAKGVVIVE
ncbi:MAG: cupredoxin domain-containing protein [Burkholderiales bacterium]|jgi:hypothetical protein|nr:cupredoxin domain-containing protein [Burkholderiales bacterium]